MFKCPINCNSECPAYDEKNDECMHNVEFMTKEEALARAYKLNPRKCFIDMD
jgi:hypothetical protein